MSAIHGTAIEWTHIPGFKGESWNPIRAENIETGARGWFCVHASEGCRNCYAERINTKAGRTGGNGLAYSAQNVSRARIVQPDETLTLPLRWKAPRAVFVCSMSDLFGEFVPDEMIDRIFAIMALCPQHRFMVLTKRAKRMYDYLTSPGVARSIYELACDLTIDLEIDVSLIAPGISPDLAPANPKVFLDAWPLSNVWLGVSVEDQARADERIPHLLATPAAVRFLSCEPLLGPVNLRNIGGRRLDIYNALTGSWEDDCDATGSSTLSGMTEKVDWVICGGESGPNARPMHPDWARSLRDQCAAAGAPFFFKQWGEWSPGVPSRHPGTEAMRFGSHLEEKVFVIRVGKRAASRSLDGIEHNGFPEVT